MRWAPLWFHTLVSETGSLIEPQVFHFSETRLPVSLRDASASALQPWDSRCTPAHLAWDSRCTAPHLALYVGVGDWIWVLMLAWQAFC